MTSHNANSRLCDTARVLRAAGLLFVLIASSAYAQPPADDAEVTPYLHNVSRLESWSFFGPPAGQGDPSYTFLSTRSTLGVRLRSKRLDVEGAFQYAQILGLPEHSIGVAGPLGTGALYFAAARAPQAFQLYFKSLHARVKNILPGLSVTAGRMGYASGAEGSGHELRFPIAKSVQNSRNSPGSGHESRAQLKQLRLESRLIGEFEWSVFQRAFDGLRLDLDRPRWRATTAVLFPTQGGFEESANPAMSTLRVTTGVVTFAAEHVIPRSELQLFAYHYRDQRPVRGRPDNAGVTARAADVSIVTFGASQVGSFRMRGGEFDSLIWVAAQTGDWYGDDHGAISIALEGGYKWRARWRPWIRAGWLHASGDEDPTDERHGTFFQMLPTSRRYALSTAYAQMNLRDLFAQVLFEPHRRVNARAEVHRLALARGADRWYSGSGATAERGDYFGYSARVSGGLTSLGTAIEGSADVQLTPRWSLNGYIGTVLGDDVVRATFAGDRLRFAYLESVLSF